MNYVGNPFQSPTIISYCPGILGLDRGLERAIGKFNVAAYVEIEAFIITNLVAGMEAGVLDPSPIWTDAKTFPSQIFRNRIHGIIGGYPCQPFSTAGKQKGKEDERHLWLHIFSSIRTIKPVWIFFENVEAHLTNGYIEVRASLEAIGYIIKEGIYSAEEVGAPHQRRRLFFLGILGDTKSKHQWNGWYKSIKSERQVGRSGIELANANCTDATGNTGNICSKSEKTKGKTQGENGQWLRDESGNSGKGLADTSSAGLQRMQQGLVHRKGKGISGPTTKCCPENFPLGQGPDQWEWEEPRTVESSMVYTVNGYNFIGDLHRAIGNSVVEQTAELAFVDLLKKHFY